MPIPYQLVFSIDSGLVHTLKAPDTPGNPYIATQRDATGITYYGYFELDSEILGSDGFGKTGDLTSFIIRIEDNIWANIVPGNNSFVGFRGPDPNYPRCYFCCTTASSPGFDVVAGEIMGLRGWVFDSGDIPFFRFFFDSGGQYRFRVDPSCVIPRPSGPDCNIFRGEGTVAVVRVSEPSTRFLLALGVTYALILMRQSRQPIARNS